MSNQKILEIFVIGFNEAIDTDVEFNWWIIELDKCSEIKCTPQLLLNMTKLGLRIVFKGER